MSELAEVALKFCQRCLGWDNAQIVLLSYMPNTIVRQVERNSAEWDYFRAYDLAEVTATAEVWSERSGVGITIDKEGVLPFGVISNGAEIVHGKCLSILRSCLAANRKLQATKGTGETE